MGMFQQMTETRSMVQAAPSMVQAVQAASQEAQRLGSAMQAQQLADARAVTVRAAAPNPAHLEPIAGVTLERYAEISRGLAGHGHDTSMAATIAAASGISADDWQTAMDGWNARKAVSPAVARAVNRARGTSSTPGTLTSPWSGSPGSP